MTEAIDSDRTHRRSLAEMLSTDELTLVVEPRRDAHGDVGRFAEEAEQSGAGAVCLSVDAGYGPDDLAAARRSCGLPIVARGGVADAARVAALHDSGADVVMVGAGRWLDEAGAADENVPDEQPAGDTLAGIVREAHRLGMEVVLTVHDEQQLALAIETDADALNIDNRAADGSVDVERTFDLLAQVPVGWPVISESIASLEQVPRLLRAGVDALLLDEGHLETNLPDALAAYATVATEQQ